MGLITSRPKIRTTVDGLPLAYQLFVEGNYVPLIVEVERSTQTDDLTNTIVTFSASGGEGEYYISKSSDFPAQISLISINADRIRALVKLVKEDTLFFLDGVTAFKYSVGLKTDLGLMELESGFFNVNPSLTLGKQSQAQVPDAAPLVELTAPKSGDKLFVGKAFKLLAKASDIGGAVEKVEFFANDILIGTNNSYSVKGVWDLKYVPTQAGSVTFYSIAHDSSDNETKSNAIATTVEPEPIAPTANFGFTPLTGSAPLSVTFINTSVNAATYSWNFGDGSALSTAIAPTHIYQASGSYTITLSAINQYGTSVLTKNITVTVAVNQPPTVSISNPINGSSITVGQQVSLTASATDDGSVSSVQFRVNGADVGVAKTAPPYTQAWTPSTAGSFTITAIATDDKGLSTTSIAVSVTATATANEAPVVTITNPAGGTEIIVGQQVTLTATATDDGSVASVLFRVNGVSLGSPVTGAPYTQSWTPTTAGNFNLTAVATDDNGLTTTSDIVSVVVAVPAPTVVVSAPKAGLINESQTLNANASVTGDTISSVQFQVNAANQGTADTSPPYSTPWMPTTKGTYGVRAIATAALGGTTTSSVTNVPIYDTKLDPAVSGGSGAGCSLGAQNGSFILFDNNVGVGGLAATMTLTLAGDAVGAFNYLDEAYAGKPFAFFNVGNATLYTGTIAPGAVPLNV